MKQLQLSKHTCLASPFEEIEPKMFLKGLPCRVTRTVRALDRGRAALNGTSWLAQLHEPCRSITLLPDQPALAIGHQGNTLIIMPLHCLLWPEYLEAYSLTAADIELIECHEREWRH